jgi:hypothetical protein
MEGEVAAIFTVLMTGMILIAWLLNGWIKGRRPAAAPDALQASRQVELLANENAGLKGQVSRLEERLSVLERIATDPAERTAREIEQLR